jgi:hypothetical protein
METKIKGSAIDYNSIGNNVIKGSAINYNSIGNNVIKGSAIKYNTLDITAIKSGQLDVYTNMFYVTYNELVELRDNGELVSGAQYRITDYVTTTSQPNTRSASTLHFDVIVTADSP